MTTWYDDEPDDDGAWRIKDILDDIWDGDERCWIPWDERFDDD